MLAGVKIILERMKTHPEDFAYNSVGGMSNWSRLIDRAIGEEILTKEEIDALNDGVKNCRREMFNQKVMQVMAGEEQESSTQNLVEQMSALNLGTQIYQHPYENKQLEMQKQLAEAVKAYKATGQYK